jgi:hypothetical protein
MSTSIRHSVPRLLLTAATCLLLATPAQAAPSVTAQAVAGVTGLPMDGRGSASTHIVKIADISASTASTGGFTMSISSGNLTKGDGSTPVAFQVVLVAQGASAPSSSAFTTASGTTYRLITSDAGSVDRDLYIKYTPASLQDPGTYSAAVQIQVQDN